MERNEILKIYGTDYKAMTLRLLEEAGLADRIGSKAARIGIKPNLVSPYPAENGGTTHPEIVAGIVEYLQSKGFTRLRILEGSWVGDRTAEAFEVCGYNDLSRRYGVPLTDLQKDKWTPRDCGGMEIDICNALQEVDFLITVPVLKGHCQTKMTCCLKNLKGLIPNKEKRHFHAMGLHKPIAHLNAGIRQDFIVIDHICGDPDFEDGGNPLVKNGIFAALDPVLADALACRLLRLELSEVPYIGMAEALGVGSSDLTHANIRAIDGYDPEGDDARCGDRKIVELNDAVQEVESCSACYGYLIPALDMLRSEGLLEELKACLPEKLCIGQGFRGKGGRVGIGSCTSGFDFCIKGCPPTEQQIYEGLKEYLRIHGTGRE